jgi:rare lipoprotein A
MGRLLVALALLAAGCASAGGPARGSRPASGVRVEEGVASWYGAAHHGRRTASGKRFDMGAMTAAHRSLPFGARVRVTSLATGRAVVVRVNDRGPYAGGRIIDLSRAAAEQLGIVHAGTARVRIEIVD